MRVSTAAYAEVAQALEEYRREVLAAKLAPNTKHTYLYHAETFVRWLDGHFEPGARIGESYNAPEFRFNISDHKTNMIYDPGEGK